MKTLLLLFLLIFLVNLANAQQYTERVYLKDSITFYEGYVIEQAPARYVKIFRLKEKDTILVNLVDIWKLTKNYITDTTRSNKRSVILPDKNKYTKIFFAEFFGNGILYSLNYDMRTAKGVRDKWGLRVGFEWIGFRATDTATKQKISARAIAFPFAVNYLVGKHKGFLELGFGATYFFASAKGQRITDNEAYTVNPLNEMLMSLYGTFNIGYRHVPYKKGIMYHFLFTPVFGGGEFASLVGAGIGYHFN
jgi:hypothetical protein